jgi:hypothetical protein
VRQAPGDHIEKPSSDNRDLAFLAKSNRPFSTAKVR